MNFRNHPRARRIASCVSTLSLVATSSSLLSPVYAQTTGTPMPMPTTPEQAKKQEEIDRRKKVIPPNPGNPAVIIDPTTGSGNNIREFNRDGSPRTTYRPKRDYGDHQAHPDDPRMVTDVKDLPIYGYNFFADARRVIEAKRKGLLNALGGNVNSSSRNVLSNSSSRDNANRNTINRDGSRNNDPNTNRDNIRDNNQGGNEGDAGGNRRSNSDSNNAKDDSNKDGRSNTDPQANRDNQDPNDTSRPDDNTSDAERRRLANRKDADSNDAALEDNVIQNRLQGYQPRNGDPRNTDPRNANPNDPNSPLYNGNRRYNNGDPNYPYNSNYPNYPNYLNGQYGGYYNIPNRMTVSGFEGIIDPLTQITNNIIASAPATYQLSGGDEVVIHITTPKLNPVDMTKTVDALGNLDLGEMGRVVVRGKTLDQLESDLQKLALRFYKGAQVSLNLKQLRTISVTVQGEAVQPGNYVVPAVISAFNMLYAVGGPNEDGSLREIKVMRQGKEVRTLDFYKYMKGDGQEDIIMRAGDVLVIPSNGNRVALMGEVRHPALYELKDSESLQDALRYAGGVKASGVDQIVQLNTLEPGLNRVLKNINLQDKAQVAAVRMYDGDSVEIHSVRQIVDNKVHISGAISQPGDFALTPGMKVADLLRVARNPISEAYLGRAALKRWNGDNTTTLIPIDLAKAIENDPQNNIPLMKWDSLEIYSRAEAAFVGTRKIEVRGAVQHEGVYEYSQNMHVLDILLRAGGALPNAERIEIIHQHGDGTFKLEPVLVADVAHGDPAKNVVLEDNDIVAVYKNTEAQFIAGHQVRVVGEVVTEGFYPRGEGMRLTDALRLAGWFRPGAHPSVQIAHARRSADAKDTNGIVAVQFDTQMKCAPQDDMRLEDGDVIAVQGTGGIDERPPVVYVKGAVNSPGPIFLRSKNVRLSDAIAQAGGLRPEAFPEGAEFNRDPARLSSKTQKELASTIGMLTNLLNDQDLKSERAKADLERLKALGQTNDSTSILGGGQGSSALNNAAGVAIASKLSEHELVTDPRRLTEKELDASGNIAVNLPAALEQAKRGNGKRDDDILLLDGDTITVPETPTTVQVIGAVIHQRGVLFLPGKSLDYYIAQSGGYAPDAALKTIEVIRAGGGIIPAKNVKELRPGDVILVPTRVLAAHIAQHHDAFGDFFKSITNSAIMFKLATGVFGL